MKVICKTNAIIPFIHFEFIIWYILLVKVALVEKRLSLAHQNGLSLAHFGSPATYMPAVMLTAGEFCSSPVIIFFTAGAFRLCAGDNMLSLANL
jgi:hypothetical protein